MGVLSPCPRSSQPDWHETTWGPTPLRRLDDEMGHRAGGRINDHAGQLPCRAFELQEMLLPMTNSVDSLTMCSGS